MQEYKGGERSALQRWAFHLWPCSSGMIGRFRTCWSLRMIGRDVEALWPRKVMHTEVPMKLCNCLFPSARTGRLDVVWGKRSVLCKLCWRVGMSAVAV